MIRNAIVAAWERVAAEVAAGECSGEVPINTRLQEVLEELRQEEPPKVKGFSPASFETPIRGGEVVNYNRKKLKKAPDLTFRLAGRLTIEGPRLQMGLFVECKLLKDHGSLRTYCEKGIKRFIDGDYAWAMSHAMMIGYVSDTSLDLVGFLAANGDAYHLAQPSVLGGPSENGHEVSVKSWHRRPWVHDPPVGTEPGPIEILHLWLGLS